MSSQGLAEIAGLNFSFSDKNFAQFVSLATIRSPAQQRCMSGTVVLYLFAKLAKLQLNKEHGRGPQQGNNKNPPGKQNLHTYGQKQRKCDKSAENVRQDIVTEATKNNPEEWQNYSKKQKSTDDTYKKNFHGGPPSRPFPA